MKHKLIVKERIKIRKYLMPVLTTLAGSLLISTMTYPPTNTVPVTSYSSSSDVTKSNTVKEIAVPPSTIVPVIPYSRISGATRFDTAKAIAAKATAAKLTDVILVSGNNFQDALSASVLAKKLNAPVLLVESKLAGSEAAFDYISQNLQPSVNIHIIGDEGVISSNFETLLNSLGFANIDRIGGSDCYSTNTLIANKLSVPVGTPVIIASGTSFPELLSISPIAAANGYPILLVDKDTLSKDVKTL